MTASARCTRAVLISLFIIFLASSIFAQQPLKFDAATVSGLPARNIGSATMSGRIAALDAVVRNGRLTMFVGSASGGVWKSVNGGTTFKPVFDRQCPACAKDNLRFSLGFPQAGLDVSLRWARQRIICFHRRRRTLDRPERHQQQGPAGKALGTSCCRSSAFEAKRGVRQHRIEKKRAISLR